MDEPGKPVAESNAQEGTHPPRSGRYISLLARCRSPRALRFAALLLVMVGLFLLWLLATHRAPPLVQIAGIQPAMNGALVRVAGQATGDARTFREAGQLRSLRFTVNDGTGELSVSAYGKQAEQMALFDRIPRAGDSLEVAGSLSPGADGNITLRIQSGDALKLKRAVKTAAPLGGIRGTPEGTRR